MTAILQHAEWIRFAAMATFLMLTPLLARLVTRLAPARRARPQRQHRNGVPTRMSSLGEGFSGARLSGR
jgi:hypothetical protein